MSSSHDNAQQDALFVRNFALVLLLTVIGITITFLARHVYHEFVTGTGIYDASDLDSRIAPVGAANTSGETLTLAGSAPPADPAAAAVPATAASPGEAAYNKVCFACHAQGIASAPKRGDPEAWAPRIALGVETLYKHAVEGFQGSAGLMPPKGGGVDMTDDEVKAAVDYMVTAAQGGSTAAAPPAPAAAEPAVADTGKGKEVFDAVCFACHTPGAAGAPKFGDAAAWAPRIAKGIEMLYDHSVNGFMGEAGLMPPKGGRPDFSDEDIKAAVDFMVSNSQ
ncbi:MAG: cytochrome c5 family protein [Gammaproteobacteria bacterium]|nr:cytochrome c5 family protein [Gammaproteobacteria bacterium]